MIDGDGGTILPSFFSATPARGELPLGRRVCLEWPPSKRATGMGWATNHIAKLRAGQTVQFRPRGHSMRGRIEAGQLVTVAPAPEKLKVGDVVLCKVRGAEYLHLIKAVRGDRYLIGNNRGKINGWTPRSAIFGVCVRVEA